MVSLVWRERSVSLDRKEMADLLDLRDHLVLPGQWSVSGPWTQQADVSSSVLLWWLIVIAFRVQGPTGVSGPKGARGAQGAPVSTLNWPINNLIQSTEQPRKSFKWCDHLDKIDKLCSKLTVNHKTDLRAWCLILCCICRHTNSNSSDVYIYWFLCF